MTTNVVREGPPAGPQRIRGTVLAEASGAGVAGVRVQAWDHDRARDDFLGEATTDAAGGFEIAFQRTEWSDHSRDREPDLLFRVYRGDQLVRSTKAAITHSGAELVEVVITLKGRGDEPGSIEVVTRGASALAGRIVDAASGAGIKHLDVELWVKSSAVQERLGAARTDQAGRFAVRADLPWLREVASAEWASLFVLVARNRKPVTCVELDLPAVLDDELAVLSLKGVPPGDDDDDGKGHEKEGKREGDGAGKTAARVARGGKPEPGWPDGAYAVRGQLRDDAGKPLGGWAVRAFDKDLRTEEPLGEAVTGPCGFFEIRYGREAFARAEKNRADLVVRAYDAKAAPVAESAIRFNASREAIVDAIVGGGTWRGRSEYERIASVTAPLVAGIAAGALTEQDLVFLAGETARSADQLRAYRDASVAAQETALSAEAHYAFLRRGLSADVKALVQAEESAHRRALAEALEQNLVPRGVRLAIPAILARLNELRARYALDAKPAPEVTPPRDIVGAALPSPELQQKFMALYTTHEGAIEEFWQKVRADPELGASGRADAVQTSLKLGLLVQNHTPMVTYLQAALGQGQLPGTTLPLRGLEDLARLEAADWRRLMAQSAGGARVGAPEATPGETAEAREGAYAEAILGTVEAAFPTAFVARRVARDLPEGGADLATFLARNAAFDLKATNVRAYLDANPGALEGLQDPDGTAARLAALQRVLRVAGRYGAAVALLRAGLDSGRTIARFAEPQFVAAWAPSVGGEVAAARIHARARQTAGAALSIFSQYGVTRAGLPAAVPPATQGQPGGLVRARSSGLAAPAATRALPSGGLARAGAAATPVLARSAVLELSELPDWEALFGPFSLCKCEHCRSVYSPAAYLVDVLNLLKFRRVSPAEARTFLDVLTARRPDLVEIELSCENTNTPLPYVDLVNEILEDAVVRAAPPLDGVELTPIPARQRQTTWTASALATHPEHLNAGAYEVLRTALHPWTLPFDLWCEEVRAYLDHLGTSREAVMRTYQRRVAGEEPPDAGEVGLEPGDVAIAAEHLGLTAEELRIVTEAGYDPAAYGDVEDPGVLSHVGTLLASSGLRFDELEAALAVDFLTSRTEGPLRIVPMDPDRPCSPELLTISNLNEDVLDALHRFVRLRRRLGWSAAQLQRALALAGDGDITPALVLRLSRLKRAGALLGLSDDAALDLLDPAAAGRDLAIARGLGLRGEDVATLSALLGAPPTEASALLAWLERARALQRGPLTPAELAFLFLHRVDPRGRVGPRLDRTVLALEGIRQDLARIADDTRPPAPASRDDLLRMLHRVTDPARAEQAVRFLEGFPAASDESRALLRLHFPFLDEAAAAGALLPAAPPADDAARVAYLARATGFVLAGLAAHLRRTLGERAVTQRLADAQGLDLGMADLLLRSVLTSIADGGEPAIGDFLGVHGDGLLARYEDASGAVVAERIEPNVDLDWGGGAPDPALPAGAFRAELTGRLWAPVPDAYTFHVRTSGGVRLEIAGAVVIDEPGGAEPREITSAPVTAGGADRPLEVKLRFLANGSEPAFVRLEWSRPGSRRAVIPPGSCFSRAFDVGVALRASTRLFKAATVVKALRMTPRDLRHVVEHAADLSGLDLDALPTEEAPMEPALLSGWERLRALFGLRARLPRADRDLVDLLALAAAGATREELVELLVEISGWDAAAVEAITGAEGFALEAPDLRDATWLVRVEAAVALAAGLGLDAAALQRWARAEPDAAMAAELRSALEAKHGAKAWPVQEKPIRDALREQQRAALVAWLLPRAARVQGAAWNDANGLFHHYLIDVEMTPVQLSSRIKQAMSSVQLFVQRALMNLEPEVSFDAEDARQWNTWMKSYRVWEANRKVFLYPENWLRPELRRDKSPFFEELEKQLSQKELTDEAAEEALAAYVRKLENVSRLQVIGTYHERVAAEDVDVLHVVARTHGTPREHWYRRRVDGVTWTPWEKIDLDIEGDHVIPVIHHRRLHLFWPVFEQKAADTAPPTQSEGAKAPTLRAEVKLAWSVYQGGRWQPKKVSTAPLGSTVGWSPRRLSASADDWVFEATFDAAGDVIVDCHATEVQ